MVTTVGVEMTSNNKHATLPETAGAQWRAPETECNLQNPWRNADPVTDEELAARAPAGPDTQLSLGLSAPWEERVFPPTASSHGDDI